MGVGGSSFIEEIVFCFFFLARLDLHCGLVGSLLWPVGAFFSCGMRASLCGPWALAHTQAQ